jgi:flavin reductase (DIM6/NTAB) family NADH-FMN oxidoreductase RutF
MSPFDDLVAHVDPPLAVVTTVANGERAGCLIGFHAQCSITPQRYAIWLSKANHTFRVALHAQDFAVHFVRSDGLDVARLFGTQTGDELDKFDTCAWQPGPGGVPVLDACPDHFVARKVALLDEGSDHVCIVLEPTEASASGTLQPLRLSAAKDLTPGHEAEQRPKPVTERADSEAEPQ